jgi:hypothetical protein
METNTTDNFSTATPVAPVRPQMLSVLCILTWICCGLMLISTVLSVAFKQSPEEQYEAIEKMREASPEMAEQMEAAYAAQAESNQTVGLALNMVALGLSAFGAYMMWQLKKTGFYVYLAGEILPYFGFLTGGSEMMLASMGGTGMMTMVIGGMIFLDLLFIILYAVNLKHMRS